MHSMKIRTRLRKQDMITDIKQLKELSSLRFEHSRIEKEIANLLSKKVVNSMQLQSLKKRKLLIKEQTSELEDTVIEDIIA